MRSSQINLLSSLFTKFGSASSWFEVYAAFSTFMMVFRTAINDFIPLKLRNFIYSKLLSFFTNYQPSHRVSLQINQFWDGNTNNLFNAVKEYLPTKISNTYKSLKVGTLYDRNKLLLAFDGKQPVVDEFEGIKVKWMLDEKTNNNNNRPSQHYNNRSSRYEEDMHGYGHGGGGSVLSEGNGFVLIFDEKHRNKVMKKYLPHVISTYKTIKAEQRTLKIHSSYGGRWSPSDFNHPASFESLALDPDLKKDIIDDLNRFLKRKKIYKKVGKPWKRGYLLYGPPGTGKSSLIAAIAKYLKFDVYDLDLSSVVSNLSLTTILRSTSNRSIIVIEDIDCNKEVLDRSKSKSKSADKDSNMMAPSPYIDSSPYVGARRAMDGKYSGGNVVAKNFSLSVLLNYMDGLWASCGEERILIFTTNHKDKVDPALLRPGRMDKHIYLSFLKPKAFRILASNYLDIEEHHSPLLEQIDELLEKVDVTPAVVAEHLLRGDDADVALNGLVKLLQEIDISRGNENNSK